MFPIAHLFAALLATPMPQWPNDPAAPLALGPVPGGGVPEHAVAMGPDGSTWVAWLDDQCFGGLRLQRVSAAGARLQDGGLLVQAFESCDRPDPRLAACTDGTVVVSASTPEFTGGPLPVQRFDSTGVALWGAGITPSGLASGALGHLHGLPGGDALVLWVQAHTMYLQRYTPGGAPVWPDLLSIGSSVGANFRVLATLDDDAGGVFLVWDSPLTYTRAISVTRVSGNGVVLWPTPVRVTALTPSSRHTPPAMLADGEGGLLVLWTEGRESESTPVPLRLQRLHADGSTGFEAVGRRVSLLSERQFDPRITRHGGDLYVAWRHDTSAQQVLAQRMNLQGERLWGDDGLAVAPLSQSFFSRFDAHWHGGALSLVVADPPKSSSDANLRLVRIDAQGTLLPGPAELSGPEPLDYLVTRVFSDALVVTWLAEGLGVFAQRAHPDGTLGRRRTVRRYP